MIIHLGIALIAIGVIASSAYISEQEVSLSPGESTTLNQYILTYDNLAKMEFGIGTSRLKDKIKYDINVYQAALESSFKIWENYLLKINIQQIIPDINKRKEKKAPIPGEPTGKKKKKSYWGGTIYSIGLDYKF